MGKLNTEMFEQIWSICNRATVDMFTSQDNAQCPLPCILLHALLAFMPEVVNSSVPLETAIYHSPFSSAEQQKLNALCPVRSLHIYTKRTKEFRESDQLFVSWEPHMGKPVTKQHLFLTLFKGVTIQNICEAAYWSSLYIFTKFWNIVKYYYNLKSMFSIAMYFKMQFIPLMQSYIFSIITPVFSVTWSFRNHSNMLIWCSKTFIIIHVGKKKHF